MAETVAAAGLTPEVWDDKFFSEYVRSNRFKRYMGTNENSIIQMKEDLTKEKGDKVHFAAVRAMDGDGVAGNQVLEGNEEIIDSRSMTVAVDVIRHAFAITEWEEQKSAIDLRDAGKMALKTWFMDRMRNDIIHALMSINGTKFADADATARDAWLVDNADRVLFGKQKSNASSLDHSTALATIDNTDDKLTPGVVSLAKRIAQEASPAIRPIRLMDKDDEEWFVMFCNSRSFRDLSQHSDMVAANKDARARGEGNKLFTGGSLLWDGVIIREIPEIPVISSTVDVAPNFLCGAQAVGVAWARRFKSTTNVRDYGFRHGVGGREIRGIEKLRFGTGNTDTADTKDHGVVTVYTAGVADA